MKQKHDIFVKYNGRDCVVCVYTNDNEGEDSVYHYYGYSRKHHDTLLHCTWHKGILETLIIKVDRYTFFDQL